MTFHDIIDKMPLIEEFVNLAAILQLDSLVTKKSIEVRIKHKKLKLGEAIIPATAITYNLILVTNKIKDFANIKDLKIVYRHNL